MLEKEFCLLNSAYESYNLDERENISSEILKYIRDRIVENKELIETIINSSKENIKFDELLKVYDEEVKKEAKYKFENKFKKLENSYVYKVYTAPIGNIVVECSNSLTALRYYINAIKSRDTITISDTKYKEVSLKSALLIIFCEALSKFKIDMNLIMLIPYEECYYDKYDRLIYADSNKKSIQKEVTDKLFIYVEDESFEDDIKKEKLSLGFYNKQYEILTGDFYEAVHKINEKFSNGASIYTKNHELATKFMILVHSKNVFVNSSLIEMETTEDVYEDLYMRKKVMYPLDLNVLEETKENIHKDEVESETLDNMQLIKQETSPWYIRIFESIKNFLKNLRK